jgi:hypothetical protein
LTDRELQGLYDLALDEGQDPAERAAAARLALDEIYRRETRDTLPDRSRFNPFTMLKVLRQARVGRAS